MEISHSWCRVKNKDEKIIKLGTFKFKFIVKNQVPFMTNFFS